MKEMKGEPDTWNGYFGEHPVHVVTLRLSIMVDKKLAMKEMKDEPDTCNGYSGEHPLQVVTLTPVHEMR